MAEVAHPDPQTHQPTGPTPTNGLAIAALVVGIVALITGWAPFWGFIVGVAAVVLGILGLRKPGPKGMSIAGLVTGAVGALWSLAVTIIFILGLALIGASGSIIEQATRDALVETQGNTTKTEFAKGEVGEFGQLEVTVNSVERDYQMDDDSMMPNDGNELLRVNVTVKNVSSLNTYVSPSSFDVVADGTAHIASYRESDPAFKGKTLEENASNKGNIIFEIPAGAKELKLQHETIVLDMEVGTKEVVYTLAL